MEIFMKYFYGSGQAKLQWNKIFYYINEFFTSMLGTGKLSRNVKHYDTGETKLSALITGGDIGEGI